MLVKVEILADDGTVLWTETGDALAPHAWRIEPPVRQGDGRFLWGMHYHPHVNGYDAVAFPIPPAIEGG